MPFHSLWAMLWWARILASLSAGQRHCMWLCVSAGWLQRAQAAEGTMPHLWSTALQGNAPAMDWSTCFFAVEIFISASTLPSVLRP